MFAVDHDPRGLTRDVAGQREQELLEIGGDAALTQVGQPVARAPVVGAKHGAIPLVVRPDLACGVVQEVVEHRLVEDRDTGTIEEQLIDELVERVVRQVEEGRVERARPVPPSGTRPGSRPGSPGAPGIRRNRDGRGDTTTTSACSASRGSSSYE